MNLKEFINELYFISDEHIRTKKFAYKQFILALNDEKNLYFLNVETSSEVNPFVLGIKDNEYYISHIENFIRNTLNDSKHIRKFYLPFNITDACSQNIIIYMQPCLKSQNFVYLNTEYEKNYQKDLDMKWKEKILFIISNHGGGITLSNLISLTRGIRNSNIRKQYLRELLAENKIEMFQSGRYSKRPKTFYRIKSNAQNTESDNTRQSDPEAAIPEGNPRSLVQSLSEGYDVGSANHETTASEGI